MKRFLLSLFTVHCSLLTLFSQAPQGFNYQAVARDDGGELLASQPIEVKIGIRAGSEGGTLVWEETHAVTTNEFGLFTLKIGDDEATPGSGTASTFSDIDWSTGAHYLEVSIKVDVTFIPMGTSELLSVPFALFAEQGNESQDLHLAGDILTIDNGVNNINLGVYLDDTDNQGLILSNDILSIEGGSGTVDLSDYIDDADASTTNEIQDLSLTGNTLSLSGDATTVDLTGFMDNTDNQHLTLLGNELSIEDGNAVILTDNVNDADHDSANELQSLTLTDHDLGLTNSATKVDLTPYLDDTNPWGFNGSNIFYNDGNVGVGTETPTGRLEVMGNISGTPEDPLFEVKRKDGHTVFAVYEDSVRIYVNMEETLKGTKGGFAVGGFNPAGKGLAQEYLRVTPDSVRVYIDQTGTKGTKGGFAVGGFNPAGKGEAVSLFYLSEDNYFIGHETGIKTTGTYNTFIGYQAGKNNTIGYNNIFIGHQAGLSNTKGDRNIFIGTDCGISNTEGLGNIFMGWGAGGANETGNNNIFIGANCGAVNSSGSGNMFIGVAAGYQNTTGSYNSFVGSGAGNANDDGYWNTFVGYAAGSSNIAGGSNAFLGGNAGRNLTASNNNTFLGYASAYSLTSGNDNVQIGASAGSGITTGYYNVMIGSLTGANKTGGNSNVMIGYNSGRYNTTGQNNVFIGREAGRDESGSYKLYIESSAATSPLIYGDFDANYVVINGNNTHRPSGYEFFVNGQAGGYSDWGIFSDTRLKENVQTIPSALAKVRKLRGVNFEWKDKENGGEGMQMGFIAQEAMDVIPEVVKGDREQYSMQYAPITALLVEAMKEQQKMIEQQQAMIEQLQERIEWLEKK